MTPTKQHVADRLMRSLAHSPQDWKTTYSVARTRLSDTEESAATTHTWSAAHRTKNIRVTVTEVRATWLQNHPKATTVHSGPLEFEGSEAAKLAKTIQDLHTHSENERIAAAAIVELERLANELD